MGKRGKEISSVVFSNFLNVSYLPEKELYIFKKDQAKYKFNVIGAGMIAQEHIRVTMLEGRAEIKGMYDINENSINQAQNMYKNLYPKNKDLVVYKTLHEACNDPDVQGLIICTPNYTHIEIVREAIKSGKHILMEKPMVTKLEDAIEMKKIAESYKSTFQVGLQYRYKAIYSEAREEVLNKKALGKVHTISIVEQRIPFLDKLDQWNKFSEFSGGTLVEKCCHYFDLFNLFAGAKPEFVYAVGGQAVNFTEFEYNGKRSDILDHAIVTVVYENGVKCDFNLCMFSPMFYEEITICGEEGRLRAFENEDYMPDARPQTHLEILTGANRPSKIMTPCYPKTIQSSGHMGGTYFEHKYFVDNIEGKKTDTATIEEGFWSVVVGIAAEQSIKTGEKVYIKDLIEKATKK
ncbi:MAG: Gfo/Idh/MocA family protein [Fusobacteriaceae bacterium]